MRDQSDVEVPAAGIEPGGLAGMLVEENVWLVPRIEAIDRSGGGLLGQGRVEAEDLLPTLDVTESA